MSFTWQLMNLQADLFQLFTKGNKIKDKNIIQVICLRIYLILAHYWAASVEWMITQITKKN